MANKKHILLIKQGAKAIVNWRLNNPNEVMNLKDAKLQGANLKGAYLQNANLEGPTSREPISWMPTSKAPNSDAST